MKQALIDTYGKGLYDCFQLTENSQIEIFDNYDALYQYRRCFIKTDQTEPVHFTLFNSANKSLTFASIDNCILDSTDPARCDFIIGNFEKLYFVEIKQVKTKQRALSREEAIKQLHSSLDFIKNRIDLKLTKVIAVICLKAKQAYPLKSASKKNDVVIFKERHNADLVEGQSDIFLMRIKLCIEISSPIRKLKRYVEANKKGWQLFSLPTFFIFYK